MTGLEPEDQPAVASKTVIYIEDVTMLEYTKVNSSLIKFLNIIHIYNEVMVAEKLRLHR